MFASKKFRLAGTSCAKYACRFKGFEETIVGDSFMFKLNKNPYEIYASLY